MPTISKYSMQDFERYGISYLTGESCAYAMRGLCDLNQDGVDLMASFLGIKPDAFVEAWNKGCPINGKPAIASVLIAKGAWDDLAKFILWDVERCHYIFDSSSSWQGINYNEIEQYPDYMKIINSGDYKGLGELYRNPCMQKAIRGRMQHQMSGRIT